MKLQKLKVVFSKVIHPRAPYNFNYSVYNPSHYPTPLVKYEKDKLWFSLRFRDKLLGVKFSNKGLIDKPAVKIQIYFNDKLSKDYLKEFFKELSYRFQFEKDYSEFYEKFEKDVLVGKILKKFRGMHGFCIEGLYEYLMIAILLQNANIKRTVQMTNAMLENYGDKINFDEINLFAIWKPERLIDVLEEELRKLKVGYRAKSFLRATKDFLKLDEFAMRKLDDSELKKELLKIYGVGPASVDYIMIGVFNRSILNTIPPWEAKIYSKLLNLDTTSPQKIMDSLDKNYGKYKFNVIGYLFADISWKHKLKRIDWLERLLPY